MKRLQLAPLLVPSLATASCGGKSSCDCPDGFTAAPDDDVCVKQVQLDATFHGTEREVCDGDKIYVYGIYGALIPDGGGVQDDVWGQDNDTNDGRLNEVGVWSCASGSTSAASLPIGEWIGFSACLELDTAATYLVGIAGDNGVRLHIDGDEVFSLVSDDLTNFKRWHIIRVPLSSGTHTIELMGINNENVAAFGAEIYGPYTPEQVATDDAIIALDIGARDIGARDIGARDIVWSTGDWVGQTFELGESSGWSCPDGTAFDSCSSEPACVERTEESCEG